MAWEKQLKLHSKEYKDKIINMNEAITIDEITVNTIKSNVANCWLKETIVTSSDFVRHKLSLSLFLFLTLAHSLTFFFFFKLEKNILAQGKDQILFL